MARPRSLKQSLYFNFLAAALLPILAVSLLVLYHLTSQTLKDVTVKNLLLARAVSGKVEVFLREPRAILEGMGILLREGENISPATIRDMLDAYVQTSEIFEAIYILGPGGKVLDVGLTLEKAEQRQDLLGIDLGHFDFFEEARGTGQITWSDTYPSLVSGKTSLALAVPVDQWVLVGNINLEILGEFVNRIHDAERVFVTIVDRSGSIIVHHDPDVSGLQENIGHLPLIRSGLAGEEVTQVYQFHDREYLGSVSLVPDAGWIAVASQTTEDAYHHVRMTGGFFLAGSVGAILLAILLAYARAGKLSRPLAEFSQRAGAIAAGSYEIAFSQIRYQELMALAESFRRMAAAVRKREKELFESREDYRQLVESINDGMGVLDGMGIFEFVNPRLAEMLGYAPEELVGQPAEKFIDSESRGLFHQSIGYRDERSREIYEIAWNRRDHSRLDTIFSPHPIETGGCAAVITDITPLKLARQAERRAREQLDAVIDSVADGLIVTDLQNRILLINHAAEELLCISSEGALHRPVRDVVAYQGLLRVLGEAVAGKEGPSAVDLDIPCPPDQGQVTVQVRSSPAINKRGKKFGVILLLRDVTQERHVARMKDEFISTVAHEFRTPLTSIQGFAQVLLSQEGLSEAEQKEFLTYIHERSVTLSGIVASLLDIARIRAGLPLALDRREWTVGDLVLQVEPFLKTQAARHRLEVEFAEPETLLWVDREKVGQVLENLLSNAVKYSSPDSLITLSGELLAEGYRISVRDRGVGMSREEAERVFEKFYRVDASDTAVQGVGLGMSIVKMIVEQHGGRIAVESEPGKGTTVSFVLPRRKEPEPS